MTQSFARKGRKTKIGGQFSTRLVEMLESPAFRVLSQSAHRLLARLEVEIGHHGGNDNGRLPVTFDHFEQYGIHRHSIGPAIREAVALGFVEITKQGRSGNGEFRCPTLYRLTYRATDSEGSTDEWQRFETLADAEAVADAARKNKKPVAVSAGFRCGNRTTNSKSPVAKSTTTMLSAEFTTTSISRGQGVEGRAGARRPTKQASASGPIAQDLEAIGAFSSALLNSRLVKSGRRS